MRRNETLDIPVTIINSGDFNDSITVTIPNSTIGWTGALERSNLLLQAGERQNITLRITPCQAEHCLHGTFSVSVTSDTDIGKSKTTQIEVDVLGPDVTITNMTCYDADKKKNNTFGEGEIITIKAFVKNQGNENTSPLNISFYYDHTDDDHCIGSKYYETIGKYQKYPSVQWDTTAVSLGEHTIHVVSDTTNQIDELNESNNQRAFPVTIYQTVSRESSHVRITELYYHTHPRLHNEFITISNPSESPVDISNWYLTNAPQKHREKQTKLVFPDNTLLMPGTSWSSTQNASAFQFETGKKPDFEYEDDAQNDVPQMIADKRMSLSNIGGVVALKDSYNHTIDCVIYGKSEYNSSSWDGPPVASSGVGVILKRTMYEGKTNDTNTAHDWDHPRRYGIGQSDFPYQILPCTGEITTFVSPDCSYAAITRELRNATDSIYFNIYEFTNPFLCDELVLALRRNVSVFLFVEGSPIGGIDDREKYILQRIHRHGGKIRLIVNDQENNVYARYTFDHGKYLIIDNQTVIVESCNWAKTGIPSDPSFGNREWGIIVRNASVAQYFRAVFLDDWNPQRCDSYSFDMMNLSIAPGFELDRTIYSGRYSPVFQAKTYGGTCMVTPVFSPDTSEYAICDLLDSAMETIYIEQLYIYKNWKDSISPFVERLVHKAQQGVKIKIILNYNLHYEATNDKCNETKQYLEDNGIQVKFMYSNWSYFANMHNKGMIVDNRSVLISSINWNKNSVTRNREAGIIIDNEAVAQYYTKVFWSDWCLKPPQPHSDLASADYKNSIYIAVLFTMTFALIAHDWRKRTWT